MTRGDKARQGLARQDLPFNSGEAVNDASLTEEVQAKTNLQGCEYDKA